MSTRKSFRLLAGMLGWACLVVVGPAVGRSFAQDAPPPPPAPGDPNGMAAPVPAGAPAEDPNVQVMTRGPVHEAYAMPVTQGQAAAGIIVPRQPPAAVDEVPPDMKPESDKATWIPGYWGWDEERKDFIWVSGVWRVPPPGFRWMPGYWQDNQGQGNQWISGYWMPAHLQEVTYLPQPQPSIDNGPTSEQPDPNHFWVAGHWQWYDGRYAWQPGYWAVSQPDWIWVPATYSWCPRGWVYVPGYWDYPLARRGLVFSPVYFAGPVAVYRPAVCLDVGVLSFSLFCRPAYCHYYFGDYYDDHYVAIGIRPWFYYNSWHHGYDPLFGYYRWYHEDHMGEREWGNHLAGWHEYYRVHPDMRPPHTLAEQRALIASGRDAKPSRRTPALYGPRRTSNGCANRGRDAPPGGFRGAARAVGSSGAGDDPLPAGAAAVRAELGRGRSWSIRTRASKPGEHAEFQVHHAALCFQRRMFKLRPADRAAWLETLRRLCGGTAPSAQRGRWTRRRSQWPASHWAIGYAAQRTNRHEQPQQDQRQGQGQVAQLIDFRNTTRLG